MSNLILILLTSATLALALHLMVQFRQTARIRQELQQARTSNTVNGVHYLRNTGR